MTSREPSAIAREARLSGSSARILIVDDEHDVLTVLRFALEAEGYRVLTASDGEQGLALARRERPDLILLDLMLPQLDGYKVCRALKRDGRHRDIPIFILSARTGETDRRLALELGADEFHTKPYNTRALVASVRARLAARPGRSAA